MSNPNNDSHSNQIEDITVRETTEEDLLELYAISCDPLVAAHQYKFPNGYNYEFWKQDHIASYSESFASKSANTILFDGEIVGFINLDIYDHPDIKACDCSWNLKPTHWGKKIMRNALAIVYDKFFEDPKAEIAFADCFSSNYRCIRLLKRLNFVKLRIPIIERIRVAYRYRCLKWRLHFGLIRDQWGKYKENF